MYKFNLLFDPCFFNLKLEPDYVFPCGRYPSLRVAYIDEVEEPSKDRKKINQKAYYSVLVKAAPPNINSAEPVQNLDQVQFYHFQS